MKKKILSLALALALSAGLAAPALAVYETPTFTDVPKSHWAYTYVEQAAKEGWVSGTGNGKFQPDGMVTYAQFCVMLTNAFTFFQDRLAQYTGPSSPWYAPYCGTIGEMGYFNQTAVKGKHTDDAVMNSPINRYDMAGMLYPIFERAAHISVSLDYEAVQASTPDYEASPIRYQTPIALVKTYGIISGIDSAGNFGGSGNMTRAQAAVVLCKMHEAVQKNIPTWYTEQQEKPAYSTEPDQSTAILFSGNYGPVGTISDTPVTLSLETHKPIHDYWGQQSAEIRNIADKDCFNAAVQTVKDAEMILTQGEFRDDIGKGYYQRRSNANINIRYNYATFDPKQYYDEQRRTLDAAREVELVLAATRGLSFSALGKCGWTIGSHNILTPTKEEVTYGTLTLEKSQGQFFVVNRNVAKDEKELNEVFAPIFARFPANATDRQKAEICLQEIADRFDYNYGEPLSLADSFTWINGKTKGVCDDFAWASIKILSAAGIPAFWVAGDTSRGPHAWAQAYIDGSWYIIEGTMADSTGEGSKGIMSFSAHEQAFGYPHSINNADWAKVTRALVEASLS